MYSFSIHQNYHIQQAKEPYQSPLQELLKQDHSKSQLIIT